MIKADVGCPGQDLGNRKPMSMKKKFLFLSILPPFPKSSPILRDTDFTDSIHSGDSFLVANTEITLRLWLGIRFSGSLLVLSKSGILACTGPDRWALPRSIRSSAHEK